MRQALLLSCFFLGTFASACVGDTPSSSTDAGSDVASPVPDGGQDSAADSGAWSPSVLAGKGALALWLEASSANLTLSSGKVGVWKDLSGNHNDAINSAAGPTVDSGAVNGHDAVSFDGVTLQIADSTSLQLGTDQAYVVAVTRVFSGNVFFFSKAATGVSGGGPTYSSGLEFYANPVLLDAGSGVGLAAHIDSSAGNDIAWNGSSLADSKFHLVALRRTTSSSLEISVDGAPPVTATTQGLDVSAAGKIVVVGGFHYGNVSPAMKGEIAELLVLHDAKQQIVADQDVTDLGAYLKKKYGL